MRYLCLFAVMAGLLPALCSAQCLPTQAPNPAFVPPIQYPPSGLANGNFWYGTDALWTALSVDGKWKMADHAKGQVLTTKLIFWGRGFDSSKKFEPELTLTGKRLDGDAPSLAVSPAHKAFVGAVSRGTMPPAMMIGLDVPTAGCWELTAHYGGHTLTFVVSVEP